MKRCKNCRFWSKREDTEPLGSCERWIQGYGHVREEIPPDEVWIENDEGWGGYMGPDFGCVLHEPKEARDA